jgi:type IV pilus assembly protein PilB
MGDEHEDNGEATRPVEHDGYEIIATRRIKKNYYEVVLAQARADARSLRSHGASAAPAAPSSVIAPPRPERPAQTFAPRNYEQPDEVISVPSAWVEDAATPPAPAEVAVPPAPPAPPVDQSPAPVTSLADEDVIDVATSLADESALVEEPAVETAPSSLADDAHVEAPLASETHVSESPAEPTGTPEPAVPVASIETPAASETPIVPSAPTPIETPSAGQGVSDAVIAASAALIAEAATAPKPAEAPPAKRGLFARPLKADDDKAKAEDAKADVKRKSKDRTERAKTSKSRLPAAASKTQSGDKSKKGFFTLSLRKTATDADVAAAASAIARARSASTRPRVTIDPKTGLPIHTAGGADDANASSLPAVPGALSNYAPPASKGRGGIEHRRDEARVSNEFQAHLVSSGLVTEVELERAWDSHLRTGRSLFESLDELNILDEDRLTAAVSEFYNVPVCDLPHEALEPAALDLVPESIAREHMVFPVNVSPDRLFIAVAEPSERLSGLLSQASGHPIVMAIAKSSDIRWAIDSNYHALVGVAELVEEFELDESPRRTKQQTQTTTDTSAAENAPIVQVVNRILSQAMRDGASDVHIEPADDIVRVRNRVDGVLKVVLVLPAAMGVGLVSRIKIMADMNIVERRRPQDGKFTATVDGREIDVRVATVATIWGETCVLRILDKTRSVLGIDDLGMAPDIHVKFSKQIRSPFGMVLCVGPTGSGKTTTLYASLNEISDSARNVMTIEDPVEYVFPSINQIQTNEAAGLTFATGLKSILRQDSDIVLVGEIRDVETAQIAVQSTLTGHFVLSSLHATDAISALTRFIDMGIESFLIASAVNAIVGQRLVRRICNACKTTYTPTDEEMAWYRRSGGPDKDVFYHGAGCNFCGHTGFKDRIGVYELFEMTPEMKRLIVGFATEDELRDLAKKQGMRTLQDEAVMLVSNDVTTSAEVVRSIYSI